MKNNIPAPRLSWRWLLSRALDGLRALALAAVCVSATAGNITSAWPALVLQDQDGRPLPLPGLAGKTVVLNFVFTGCSTVCPVQTRELAEVRRAVSNTRAVQFVSVSVDPLNDTPASLKKFAQARGANQAGWRFATGRPGDIEQLVARLGARDPRRPGTDPADHRTTIYLIDPQGRVVQRYAGVPVDRARLAREVADADHLFRVAGAGGAAR